MQHQPASDERLLEIIGRPLRGLDPVRRLQYLSGALALAVGFVHALAGEEHFTIWWGYGLFFSIVSICQIMGGGALFFWGGRGICRVGIVGTAVVLLVYIITRTVGVPFGPEAGDVEGVGVLDLISKVIELALLACLVALYRSTAVVPAATRAA